MKRTLVHVSTALLLSGLTLTAGQTQPQPANGAIIEGTVIRADTSQPLKGARVTLQRALARQPALVGGIAVAETRAIVSNITAGIATVTTDGNGKFMFTNVDPGQYEVSADREGFVRSVYGQRTPTGNGVVVTLSRSQRLTIELKMIQSSVIGGRVFTLDGEPATEATVQAYTYQYSNGQRSLAEVRTVQTNDLGEYRLFALPPGEYFVSADPKSDVVSDIPTGAVDVSQTRGRRDVSGIQFLAERGGHIVKALGVASRPPIYYPGTLDPDEAMPIRVPASAEVRGVDFALRPVSTATLSGRVVAPFGINTGPIGARGRANITGPDGEPVPFQMTPVPIQLSLSRVGETGLGSLLNLRLGATPVNPDGSFEIKGVAPGEYNLLATATDPNGQKYTARTRVHVASSDIANLTLSLRAGVEIRGRVLLDGTPPQQFQMTGLRVHLVSDNGNLPGKNFFAVNSGGLLTARMLLTPGQADSAEVAGDGSFVVSDVGAMEYRVQVTGLPPGVYVQSGRIDSIDALSGPFSVDQQATMQLLLGSSPGRVTGSVTDERGVAVPGAQAVLVPDEARRGRSDAYFAATTAQDGGFTFDNVPPGRYKLFAWEEVPSGAYQYPDFIRQYEDRGQAVSVNANGAVTAEVRLIPAK